MPNATSPLPASTDPREGGIPPTAPGRLRAAFAAITASACLTAEAQFPLPFLERQDSTHVRLTALPDATLRPDTLWANGIIPVPIERFDTVLSDQRGPAEDPRILTAQVGRWPTDSAGTFLPLFPERIDADTTDWFRMDEWRNAPDTMIPLAVPPNILTRYLWTRAGLVVQTDRDGTWRTDLTHHVKRNECTVDARDSLKWMRCSPQAGYRGTEPTIMLLFVRDRLVSAFYDNTAIHLSARGSFDHALPGRIITARDGGEEAIILSSGEVLVRIRDRWEPRYRGASIHRGPSDRR